MEIINILAGIWVLILIYPVIKFIWIRAIYWTDPYKVDLIHKKYEDSIIATLYFTAWPWIFWGCSIVFIVFNIIACSFYAINEVGQWFIELIK